MNGKIDEGGALHIERAGRMEPQHCPFMVLGESVVVCADDCPHFSEPDVHGKLATIKICHDKILHFDKFTDER